MQSHAWRTAHCIRLLPWQCAALLLLAAILVFKTITMMPEQDRISDVIRSKYDELLGNIMSTYLLPTHIFYLSP